MNPSRTENARKVHGITEENEQNYLIVDKIYQGVLEDIASLQIMVGVDKEMQIDDLKMMTEGKPIDKNGYTIFTAEEVIEELYQTVLMKVLEILPSAQRAVIMNTDSPRITLLQYRTLVNRSIYYFFSDWALDDRDFTPGYYVREHFVEGDEQWILWEIRFETQIDGISDTLAYYVNSKNENVFACDIYWE